MRLLPASALSENTNNEYFNDESGWNIVARSRRSAESMEGFAGELAPWGDSVWWAAGAFQNRESGVGEVRDFKHLTVVIQVQRQVC